ncbi:peptidase [Brevibacterium sp. 50QC2O2]|uniref:peptidase n=1 Tax=Brevibacterium TaxID=1696 RepID=UPI00211C5EF9|nr:MULTISPECIES: peptidase [unclassified Brevibacterium]MCQ9368362.1 peptidase [Brevibacterium sp. 91QC2O2]MCQ9384862.1 peptidase [Brevibacterium sp. 68QC2CO]MCQ9387627.1 peptidase [Brevibacterium sp. 50QC2O2]
MHIAWIDFILVLCAALVGASMLVFFYGLGLRLLVEGGRPPVVHPVDFPDAITKLTPKQIRKAEKKAAKAAKRNPLTHLQKRARLTGAYACFTLCGLTILGAVILIVAH